MYWVECTRCLLTSEVKRHKARSILGWVTARALAAPRCATSSPTGPPPGCASRRRRHAPGGARPRAHRRALAAGAGRRTAMRVAVARHPRAPRPVLFNGRCWAALLRAPYVEPLRTVRVTPARQPPPAVGAGHCAQPRASCWGRAVPRPRGGRRRRRIGNPCRSVGPLPHLAGVAHRRLSAGMARARRAPAAWACNAVAARGCADISPP